MGGVRGRVPGLGRVVAGLLVAAGLVGLAGCGIADTGPAAAGEPARGARAAGGPPPLRLYYLTRNGIWPVARTAPPHAGAQTAMDELLAGPSRAERARGLVSRLPRGRVRAEATAGAVDLHLPWLVAELPRVAVSQLVCTAANAPGVPGGKDPLDVVVRVHESGIPGAPWPVRCDETGTAAPLGAPERTAGSGPRGHGDRRDGGSAGRIGQGEQGTEDQEQEEKAAP